MSKPIRLSPKHGVNPTIPICFFCGKEKNEIALLGRLKGDAEAPKNVILDMEPCDECKAGMAMGYTLLGVQDKPAMDGQPPIDASHGKYLSGGFIVLSEQGVRNILSPDAAETLLNSAEHKVYIDDSIVRRLTEMQNKLQNGEEGEDNA